MKSYIKSLFSFLKKRKLISVGIVIVILFFVFRGGTDAPPDTFKVARGDLIKTVSVSGKVIATDSVEMSFDVSGTVARVHKQVGDIVKKGESIVALNSAKLQAEREKAVADLLSEEAELSKLKSSSNNTEIITNKRQVVNSIFDAYTKADDAIRNKVDQFFDDGRGDGPEIKYTFNNYFSTKDKLNDGREQVEKMLVVWQNKLSTLSVDTYKESDLDTAYTNLLFVKNFLDSVSFAVNSFEQSSDLTLSMIERYRSDVATGRSNVNTAMSELASISDNLRASISNIPVYEARVRSARAEVSRVDAEIAKTVISAPFDGIVSLQDGKVGEAVSANTKIVSVISNTFEVEVFVPEVSITGINLQNKVTINLDANTDKADLLGEVSHIDPAETEKDGVSNYKVKVKLLSQEVGVRPGMTADVTIEKERRSDVIVVPLKFVILNSSKVLVYKNKKEQEEREIVLGEKDGRGNVEVISGLSLEEILVLPPLK